MHKKLLNMARDPLTRPAVDVRLVQVYHKTHHHDSAQLSLQLVICRIPSSICIIFLQYIYWKLQDTTICGGHEKMVFHVIPHPITVIREWQLSGIMCLKP